MAICFLIQLTDCGGRDLAAPQGLGDVLHTPDGYTCKVHFNKSLFHTALPAAIPLNDGSFKGDSLELRYLESDIPGSGGEVAAVVRYGSLGTARYARTGLPGLASLPRPSEAR